MFQQIQGIGLPVVFKPGNEREQWEIGETPGSRTPICVTVDVVMRW